MTEDEAKQKWCPHARIQTSWTSLHGGVALAGTNRWEKGSAKCIASECMAWRWCVTRVDDDDNDIHDYGYCGLGGKP